MMTDTIKVKGPHKSDEKSYLNYNHNAAIVMETVASESNKEILSHRVHEFFKSAASPRVPQYFKSPKTSPRQPLFSKHFDLPKEETYNPLKLPRYETYQPLNKDSYLLQMSKIRPKVSCFRKVSPGDAARQQKFLEQEDDQFKENPAQSGPGKAANSSVMRNNNLYKIKIKVDQQMRMNSDSQKKDDGSGDAAGGEGPFSKGNFDRFNQAIQDTQAKLGARKIAKIKNDLAFTEAIREDAVREEAGDGDEEYVPELKEEENPLISSEYRKIIEASIPKYTMQNLLGLSNTMYLILKNTEFWMVSRGHKKSTKQKHFEFAKQLFKIWDADGGGSLDVDEISLPLIALGLSTDRAFV